MEYGTNRLLKQGATLVLNAKDIIDYFSELDYEENKKEEGINKKLISPQYLDIYTAIEKKKLDINSLCRHLNRPISEINSLIFMMELEGLIQKLPSGEYSIKGA